MAFVFILKMSHHTPVNGLAIPMLNGYKDIEHAFKFVVITLKNVTEFLTLYHDVTCCTVSITTRDAKAPRIDIFFCIALYMNQKTFDFFAVQNESTVKTIPSSIHV